jgi:PHD/YefM family antitoxin component YafN of YafNO toxin-antitoxin module
MRSITATELARNLRQVLDNIMSTHEEYVIERNHHQIARIIPGPGTQTALEAMADLYRTLPEDAAGNWLKDSQDMTGNLDQEIRDPWDS